jgi:hypothetical protein
MQHRPLLVASGFSAFSALAALAMCYESYDALM